ncbi:MAG TPA: hypothetical protein VFN89_03390 [Solirubrobacterales bacterium]|nr:hypothetical protein [Solirubrobacterales bacterium]
MLAARLALLAFAALAAGALAAPVAQADPANFAGASADGSKAFFMTTGKLVPGDTDSGFRDVYERFFDNELAEPAYVTRELSTGPTGGNDNYDASYDGASSDGRRVFFSTQEPLVQGDADQHSSDVYMRDTTNGQTTLVSQGPQSCVPACADATFLGATPDGTTVFFATGERLSAEDEDSAPDIYARELPEGSPPSTVLVSPGGAGPVTFDGASADGTKVVFTSTDRLVPGEDADAEADLYERDLTGEETHLVSVPSGSCTSGCAPTFGAIAANGSRVFFESDESLGGDADGGEQDVFEWSAGSGVTLVSTGGEGEAGAGAHFATYAGYAAGGSDVYFDTAEKLSNEDGDAATDVYVRSGPTTSLVSSGNGAFDAHFDRATSDGSTVLFDTEESLSGEDEGAKSDLYEQSGATTALVSPGSSEFAAAYAGASSDLSRVFYVTSQQVEPADSDAEPDIYEWDGGAASRVSSGPLGGNGNHVPHLSGVFGEGEFAFFATDERLTEGDNFLGEQDVYEHSPAGTLLVSAANSSELELGPPPPRLTGTSPASPGESTDPAILGSEEEPDASIKVYTTSGCSGAPAATGTSAELAAGEIAVGVAAGSTTTFHATATNASGDASECSPSSVTYKQESASAPEPEPEPEPESAPEGGGESGGSGGSGEGGGGTGGGSASPAPAPAPGSTPPPTHGGIAYVPPETRITFGPAFKTRVRRPVFRFTDATGQPGTSFICRIDRQKWGGCESPVRLKHLRAGRHVFRVRAVNAVGVWEARPTTRAFKLVGRGGGRSPKHKRHSLRSRR